MTTDTPVIRGTILAESIKPASSFAGHGMRVINWSRYEVSDWNSATEATIVFPGRTFRYSRGDQAGREEATEFGRRCGVPERQLDWTD
jgi:hypothetical protein